jgi:hypothetical protein
MLSYLSDLFSNRFFCSFWLPARPFRRGSKTNQKIKPDYRSRDSFGKGRFFGLKNEEMNKLGKEILVNLDQSFICSFWHPARPVS